MPFSERIADAAHAIFRHEKPPEVPEDFVHIRDISLSAAKIWFDRRGEKRERYNAAARSLQAVLTPEIIEDTRFYTEVPPVVHVRALQLLAEVELEVHNAIRTFHQRVGRTYPDFIDTGETRRLIKEYLGGIVLNEMAFAAPVAGESLRDVNRKYLGLWSGLPSDLLNVVSQLPDRATPVRINIFKGSVAVNEPTEQPIFTAIA